MYNIKFNVVKYRPDENKFQDITQGKKGTKGSSLRGLFGSVKDDALKIKFICTFNTNINNVDKAILRKGRLKVRYEFKPLSKDKANKIGKSLGVHVDKDTTLAELYNQSKVNFSEENQTKLGF